MNVDEAMNYATKQKGFWSGEVHTVIDTLAAEVERLRAKLAATKAALHDRDMRVVELECHLADTIDMKTNLD